MSNKQNIGGDRLGTGGKREVYLHDFERSTHDLGYIWRSSMASGTLVPFMTQIGLPGDTFDIDLMADVKTNPTIGPLFGSYKVQIDLFEVPMALYNRDMRLNKLGIGLEMQNMKLPRVLLNTKRYFKEAEKQINPSSIHSYVGIRGIGTRPDTEYDELKRYFNGMPFLAYWDIFKNYYANQQEENAYVIHNEMTGAEWGKILDMSSGIGFTKNDEGYWSAILPETDGMYLELSTDVPVNEIILDELFIEFQGEVIGEYNVQEIFNSIEYGNNTLNLSEPNPNFWGGGTEGGQGLIIKPKQVPTETSNINRPVLRKFPLVNIDKSLESIMSVESGVNALINDLEEPFSLLDSEGEDGYAKESVMNGLALKTYQADIFNNWLRTDWIDGSTGINEITSVDTSTGSFSIDSLNLANKVYEMLTRIAMTGGSYDDWIDASYSHERKRGVSSPVYHGSLIKELSFEEVVSNARTNINNEEQPLGQLAGRGRMTGKNKGGKVKIKINEPSLIMGIVSLTPRVCYSQGNDWHVNLDNMGELHTPNLDEIGFQDLVTDQMAFWNTNIDFDTSNPIYRSAGKIPAWVNYMTSYDKSYGTFAEENNQMFMTLNRRYEYEVTDETLEKIDIKDLTTYIDPSKFNNIFADERLDAQNFWVQIKVENKARRKMSAKVMPNL